MAQVSLARVVNHLLVVATIRLLPFVGAYAARRKARWLNRLAIALLYLLVPMLACLGGAGWVVGSLLLAESYFFFISLGSNGLGRVAAWARLPNVVLFGLIFSAYVVVPALCFPKVTVSTVVVLGCEIALSSYSYCVETSRAGPKRPALRECLFFLLVNPTVAYSDRGSEILTCRDSGDSVWTGWRRAGFGLTLMIVNLLLLEPCAHFLHKANVAGYGILALAAFGLVDLVSLYAAHAALAHVQIGCMRQIGWQVPERYLSPLSSSTPLEFWRRWNTYFHSWLKTYVFLPVGRAAYRKTGAAVVPMLAVIATLTVSGVIHSAVATAGRASLEVRPLAFFCAVCAFTVAWALVTTALRRVRARGPTWLSYVTARVAIIGGLIAAVVAWA